ncbi:MAG: DnaJ domain-containing protein [Prevotella sp.]|nr:DnaJ domain-containing protein [Prevotella sp.]
MAFGKWIGGALGFITGGPLGALAGFVLGTLFDEGMDAVNTPGNTQQTGYDYVNRSSRGYSAEEQRNSFLFSLLVLSAYIVKADRKVMHSEMEYIRKFLRRNFGEEAVLQGNEILLKLFKKQDETAPNEYRQVILDSCHQIASVMPFEQRLQLLNYLADIAKADGIVTPEEVETLKFMATNMGLTARDVEGMLNLSDASSNLEAAYKVLGVSPDATDEEVRKAYRKLALQNHPDRVATLGEDIRKAAEKKFQEINAAKETIWKSRGL